VQVRSVHVLLLLVIKVTSGVQPLQHKIDVLNQFKYLLE
jgi:hypothetical protein